MEKLLYKRGTDFVYSNWLKSSNESKTVDDCPCFAYEEITNGFCR